MKSLPNSEPERFQSYLDTIAEVSAIPNTEIFRFYSPTKLVITLKIPCSPKK